MTDVKKISRHFRITMINIFRDLKEHMIIIRRKMHVIKKNQME